MFVYEEYKNAFERGKCQTYFTKPREKNTYCWVSI